MIGGRAVNPSIRIYFWVQFMLLSCNAIQPAEVHNLPTLEEEREGRDGKVGKTRCVVAESVRAKNMLGNFRFNSVLWMLRYVDLEDSTDVFLFECFMFNDIRMECCCLLARLGVGGRSTSFVREQLGSRIRPRLSPADTGRSR